MHFVTRWLVVDSLSVNPELTFKELVDKYPLANKEEITEGIKEYKLLSK